MSNKPNIWCRLGFHDWISVRTYPNGVWAYAFRLGGCARQFCRYYDPC